jgi:hypothetical protein
MNIGSIKQIERDRDSNIYFLSKAGRLYLNDKFLFDNVKYLFAVDSYNIYAVTKDKIIRNVSNQFSRMGKYINNDDYNYKKIITNDMGIFALSFDGSMRCVLAFNGDGIDVESLYDIDDIYQVNNSLYLRKNGSTNILVK